MQRSRRMRVSPVLSRVEGPVLSRVEGPERSGTEQSGVAGKETPYPALCEPEMWGLTGTRQIPGTCIESTLITRPGTFHPCPAVASCGRKLKFAV